MPNPVQPLTKNEEKLVADLNKNKTRDWVLDELKTHLQTAIEIELATIPIYLFTYYSIVRNAKSGEDVGWLETYANMAGAAIMSVSVEEMLHMSLGCNILHAMGVAPQLYKKAPATYPTKLPHHKLHGPKGPDGKTIVEIPITKLGFMQLWHFLQIEYPLKWDAPPQGTDWETIGQFYSYIRCLISTKFITDADFKHGAVANAMQPYNYSPNNVDTVFPYVSGKGYAPGKFDPWKPAVAAGSMPDWAKKDIHSSAKDAAQYTDSEDSHAGRTQLITVSSRTEAFEAITTIGDQGEGYSVRNVGSDEHDDRQANTELSHYMKFLTLQAYFKDYVGTIEELQKQPTPPKPLTPAVSDDELLRAKLVVNFPDNPTSASYPLEEHRAIADFCSACFQYMLIMSETVYRVPAERQKLFFNEGLHRSMIWILDKYARTIREIPLSTPVTPISDRFMAPVFENVDLGPQAKSFEGLTKFGVKAIEAADKLKVKFKLKPDDPLFLTLNNVIYYVQLALKGDRKLPDVGPYWGI